jgi:hypothetical protein
MTRHQHDFVRLLAAGQIGDDVETLGLGQLLWRQRQLHFDFALRAEPLQQHGVLCAERRNGNLGDVGRIRLLPGMRQAVIGAAY